VTEEYDGLVEAIYIQPEGDGVMECVSIEVVAGPKRYVRFWPASKKTEWGWSLHPTAREVWHR
jgi:hypothetical protein